MVMHLKSCCCGCSLKTGSVIIGVVSVVVSLIGLIFNIMGASVGTGELQRELVKELEKQKDHIDEQQYNNAVKNLENIKANEGMSALFICLAVVNAIHLIMGILLIFGASAERSRLVKPWVVYAVVSLVVQTILAIVNIIFHFVNGAVLAGVLGFVILAVAVAFEVYFILVVNSFHTELISNNFQNKI